MGRIFVNYRRDDAKADARQIVQNLQAKFGKSNVFFDVKSLAKGKRFDLAIDQAVARCDAMVVVIGDQWMTLTNGAGVPRIAAEDDFVRYEIERALHHNKPILPVLLDGTKMPSAEQLPPSIRELALWNSADVAHESFTEDVDAVATQLKALTARGGVSPWWIGAAAAVALVAGLAGGVFLGPELGIGGKQADLTESLVKIVDLHEEKSGLEDRLAEMQAELDAALLNQSKLGDSLKRARTETAETQNALAGLKAERDAKIGELAVVRRDLKELTENSTLAAETLSAQIEALKGERDALSDRATQAEARLASLSKDRAGLVAEIGKLQSANRKLDGDLANAQTASAASARQLAAAEEALAAARVDMTKALEREKAATDKIAELEQSLDKAKQQGFQVTNTLNRLKDDHLASANRDLAAADAENARLKEKVARLEKQRDDRAGALRTVCLAVGGVAVAAPPPTQAAIATACRSAQN